MMLIDGANEVYMIDRDNAVFHVPGLHFPYRKDMNRTLKDTLVDGVDIINIRNYSWKHNLLGVLSWVGRILKK